MKGNYYWRLLEGPIFHFHDHGRKGTQHWTQLLDLFWLWCFLFGGWMILWNHAAMGALKHDLSSIYWVLHSGFHECDPLQGYLVTRIGPVWLSILDLAKGTSTTVLIGSMLSFFSYWKRLEGAEYSETYSPSLLLMAEIRLTSWGLYIVYPIIYRVSAPSPGGWEWDFSHQQHVKWHFSSCLFSSWQAGSYEFAMYELQVHDDRN